MTALYLLIAALVLCFAFAAFRTAGDYDAAQEEAEAERAASLAEKGS